MHIFRARFSRNSQLRKGFTAVGRVTSIFVLILLLTGFCLPHCILKCFQLPTNSLVVPIQKFHDIVKKKTVTAVAFEGVPFSSLSGAARGAVIERLVREIDTAAHPEIVVSDPVLPANCRYSASSRAHYDWLRGTTRVECKSAQLSWHKRNPHGRWAFQFSGVKLAVGGVRAFDDLLLALYTPVGIYIYRHASNMGVSTTGRTTMTSGHQIAICGPYRECSWKRALSSILAKLDSSNCTFIERVHFDDARLTSASAATSRVTQTAYDGAPLADLSCKARGDRLEEIVRQIDRWLHRDVVIVDASQSLGSGGRLCCRASGPYDWLRGNVRVECKSSQLCFSKQYERWYVSFGQVKLFPSDSTRRAAFDELLLALYTPAGVYVIRHDLSFGLSSTGRRGPVGGCQIVCCGPSHEKNWSVALASILEKFVANSCHVLAFLHWD